MPHTMKCVKCDKDATMEDISANMFIGGDEQQKFVCQQCIDDGKAAGELVTIV